MTLTKTIDQLSVIFIIENSHCLTANIAGVAAKPQGLSLLIPGPVPIVSIVSPGDGLEAHPITAAHRAAGTPIRLQRDRRMVRSQQSLRAWMIDNARTLYTG
jgi:hypothetical protein